MRSYALHSVFLTSYHSSVMIAKMCWRQCSVLLKCQVNSNPLIFPYQLEFKISLGLTSDIKHIL